MNCANHPEASVATYCRTCGKGLCERCERPIRGVIYCEDCVANAMQGGAAGVKSTVSCAQHGGVAASSYCRTCGKALCRECERGVRGVIYCEDCLAGRVQGAAVPPGVAARGGPVPSPRPAIAGILAAILPFGVGQAYNGQYSRGLVHLVVFSVLVWAGNNQSEFFGLALAAFYFYQIIDAVRSARYLSAGQPAPDPFGLDHLLGWRWGAAPSSPVSPGFASQADGAQPETGEPPSSPAIGANATDSHVPTTAIILIGLGVVFLLAHSGLMHWFWFGNVWPLIFIVIGVALLVRNWEAITTRHACLMAPVVMLTLGGLFLAQGVGHVRFGRSFPLLLIVIGVVLFWQRTAPLPPPPAPSVNGVQATPPSGHNETPTGTESETKGI